MIILAMSLVKDLKCIDCGKEFSQDVPFSTCPDCSDKGLGHGLLDPDYEYEKIGMEIDKKKLEGRKPSVWKYKESLPVGDDSKIISLEEGGTPLIKAEKLSTRVGAKNVYVKNETVNPTFSFKDRAFTVIISRAMKENPDTVAAVSDGNAGSSAAAYSSKAGLNCNIFSPRFTVSSKLIQMSTYGANVFSVNGNLTDTGLLVIEACDKYDWVNITTAKLLNPFQTEGHKTLAYEICEQLGWETPEWIITPVSSGDSLGAIWKGFREFQKIGITEKLPRMVGVQGKGAAPVVKAFEENKEFHEVEPFEPETIADALCIGRVLGSWPLNALRESNGEAVAVTDDEILEAQKALAATEGIFAEPSSAAPVAGLSKLRNLGIIDENESVVCVCTGSGLKVPEAARKLSREPVEIEPELSELEKSLEGTL